MKSPNKAIIRFRKSKPKEDSELIADFIEMNCRILPYTKEELVLLIKSGIRMGEPPLKIDKEGVDKDSIIEWFNKRIKPNTVEITIYEYETALINSLNLIFRGSLARTDFGSSRQRDFGQFVTDYTRGFIGEIAAKNLFKIKFGQEVKLEQKDIGSAKEFVTKDITGIKENGKWRDVKTKISIKTSKLQAMWVDIPESQMIQSDALLFVKVGLSVNHFASFLKAKGILKEILDIGKSKGILTEEDIEASLAKLPDLKGFPAYVPGFAYLEDFRSGELKFRETKTKKIAVGGIGKYIPNGHSEILGIGKIKEKYISSISSLRWKDEDWKTLSEAI
jgi:hypothetical protein